MSSIETQSWVEFEAKDLFDVVTGAQVPGRALSEGETGRVSVSGTNNGIFGYFTSGHANYRVFEKFVSVSFLGSVFWQPEPVSLEMKVHGLKPKGASLPDAAGLYLAAVVEASIASWRANSYGDQISSAALAGLPIRLPVTADGEPDWASMTETMNEVINERKAALDSLESLVWDVEREVGRFPSA